MRSIPVGPVAADVAAPPALVFQMLAAIGQGGQRDVARASELPGTELGDRGLGSPVVELLWFADCPNHHAVRALIHDVLSHHGLSATLVDIDATDPALAATHRFPGSPTVRVNGADVEPGFVEPDDHSPRCRLYRTARGLGGLPDPSWVEESIVRAAGEAGAT